MEFEINSPLYWDLRHARDDWPRWSGWAMQIPITTIPENGTVIDIGCGQGMECINLFKHRPDLRLVVGIDIAPSAIEKANNRLEAFRKTAPFHNWDRLRFEVQDIFNMGPEYDHGTFDYAISIQNMEHWKPEVQAQAAENMIRLVRPGGVLFFTGVGVDWNLQKNNTSPMTLPNGEEIQATNDLHYNNFSEQDIYNLFSPFAEEITFNTVRGRRRVVAEIRRA